MGRIYKRGDTWCVDYRDNGKRIRKKVGQDRKVALEVLKAFEGDAVRRQAGLSRQDVSVFNFIDEHLSVLALDCRESTITRYRSEFESLKRFLRSQGVALVSQVSPEIVERYKVARLDSASKRSVNHELTTIGAMFRRAVDMGYLENDPVSKVKRFRIQQTKSPRYLTGPEIERIKAVCDQGLRDMFEVLIQTGMRRGELLNLEWSDVDFANGYIHIRPKAGWIPKHGRSRKIPMRPAVRDILKRHRENATCQLVFHTPSGKRVIHFGERLWRAYRRAHVENATVHTTRHTFASHAVMSGLDLYTVGRLLGHADAKSTQIYAHLSRDYLSSEAGRITFGLHVLRGTGKAQERPSEPQLIAVQSVTK